MIKDLKVRLMPDKNIQIEISNLTTIIELKKRFLVELKAKEMELEGGIGVENLRFFCLGKELQDDLFLFSYDIKDEMT
eukprot:CAMPEP_0168622422 /NCGR_PEP_ID=MMETSP0449_2-20121227/8260_1 /TAXON_ID=1082188 /ORGANISM="Strombidium rassoulzadegani, Strain ras09" /LENGTH=77 /DNA_ID=CAMNT_0008663689 /DNA_START=469 /DNA_END=699 /DNA_ORIENTATION=-